MQTAWPSTQSLCQRLQGVGVWTSDSNRTVRIPNFRRISTLSGKRLLCHCRPTEACHADSIISAFRDKFPEAFDRDDGEAPAPTAGILAYLALLRTEQEEEEVSSPDEGAAPKHTGWRGTGRPLIIGTGYTEREMCDGMSLASPGRWSPEHRRYPSSRVWSEVSKLIMEFSCEHGTPELLASLALGKVKSCPFPAERVEGLKRRTVEVMEKRGLKLFRHPADRPETSIDYHYLSLLLEAADDPDKHLGEFARGVRGRKVTQPGSPRSRRRRLPGVSLSSTTRWTALELLVSRGSVEGVMDDQAERGQILRLTEKEARARFPNLTLGANKKEKSTGEITARVLFDDTHGIDVNRRTRVRDQERGPIAADIKRFLREKARYELPSFALTAGVTEAHRQVPIDPQDWHFLAAQIHPGSWVYVNKVGTFGIASASYWWSRVASAIGRIALCIPGHSAHTWHLLVADDYMLDASGPAYREAIISFFTLCPLVGVPLSWPKTAGGDTISWVGFEILNRTYKLGISERRCQWFVRWTREVAESDHVQMTNFEEGLGRVMYVVGALEYERPFLGPLYRFLMLHPCGPVRRVPGFVKFILQFLAAQIEQTRLYSCAVELRSAPSAPRVEAQASDTRTGLGGWLPAADENGSIQKWLSPWFTLEIDKAHFPWVYEKDDRPALVIASLEALTILLALKAFYGETPADCRSAIQDLDRQPRKRIDSEQTNVHPLSSQRYSDGAFGAYEGDGTEDSCTLDTTRGESRGGRSCERQQFRVRPCEGAQVRPRTHGLAHSSSSSPDGARCRSGRECCEKAWFTSGQDQETAPQTIGRAPQDDRSLVMLDVVKSPQYIFVFMGWLLGPCYTAYVLVSFHLPPLYLLPLFFTTSHSISLLVSAISLLGPLGSPHHVDDGHVSSERVWSRSTQIDEPRQATSISGHMTTPSTCILLG